MYILIIQFEMERGNMIEKTGASNEIEVLKQLKGEKIKGIIRNRKDTKIIIFHSGYGLEINNGGSFWIVSPKNVKSIINKAKEELERTKSDLEYILEMAGE